MQTISLRGCVLAFLSLRKAEYGHYGLAPAYRKLLRQGAYHSSYCQKDECFN